VEHVLKRPDAYVGSLETITQNLWVYDSESKRMVHREVRYVPGFYKILDEILVNAADNKVRPVIGIRAFGSDSGCRSTTQPWIR